MIFWSPTKLFRSRKAARRQPYRKPARFQPLLEALETRLVPANVDVTTWHYDNTLSGWNNQETLLTPGNVNPNTFGRLFTYPTDGFVFAQPLYLGNLNIPGVGTRNVVYAATENNSVYAFDADSPTAGPNGNGLYWQINLSIPRAGFTVTTVPSADTFSGDIVPQVGITGTPVINAATNTMYVVAKTKEVETATNLAHYIHRLYALDVRTGSILNSVTIGDTFATGGDLDANNITNIVVTSANTGRLGDTGGPTGPGVVGGELRFNSRRALHRSALVLAPATAQFPNGLLYMDFASHGDNGPYRGWVIAYDPSNLQLRQFFTTSLDARGAGIWQSGSPVAIDAFNNLYFATGNAFGVTPATVGARNLTEAVVSLRTNASGQLELRDRFIPFNWQQLDNVDADLGSGGTLILPDAVGDLLPNGQRRRLIVETGKEGKIYLLDRDDLGGLSPNQAAETARIRDVLIQGVAGVWGSPAFFQDGPNTGLLYYHGSGDFLKAFRITNGQFERGPEAGFSVARTNNFWGFPGSQPTVSSNGTTNGIVWELRSDAFNQAGPTVLYAYNAVPQNVPGQGNRLVQLYASDQTGQRDRLGPATKFVVPVITNGKVFAGTRNTLEVFGLFPVSTKPPAAPQALTATTNSTSQITLTWTNPTLVAGATANQIRIERSLDGVNFSLLTIVGADRTSFVDTGLTPATRYFYRIRAENNIGASPFSNVADARTFIPAPTLGVYSVLQGQVQLFWSPVAEADAGYVLQRSDDNGQTFNDVAVLPAGTTFYTDTGLAAQLYLYRIVAVASSGEASTSNTVAANLGPVVIDFSNGFPQNPQGLQLNGTPTPALVPQGSSFLVLTTGADFGQTTSAFSTSRVNISTFHTEFTFRLHDGTDPRADGFTFTIQNDPRGASAVGPAGGGLGYGPDQPVGPVGTSIRNSVAIKFDIFNNAGEGTNSTGIFTDGRSPSVRQASLPATPTALLPDRTINLQGTPIQLNNQESKRAIINYDGTTLTLRIEGEDDPTEFVEFNFTVDIRSIIGSDTAFVGFTAGTGGLTVVTDIKTWVFEPGQETTPAGPTNLVADPFSKPGSVNLTWRAFSPTADGFIIERSTDGTNFTAVQTVGLVTSATDTPKAPGTYFYRVRAFNEAGQSFPSNTVVAPVLVPGAPAQLRVARATATRVDLQWLSNSFNETGFRIERATSAAGTFETVGTVGAFTTTFSDTTVTGPNTFFYRVIAFNDFGDSLASNTVSAFIPQVITTINHSAGFAQNSDLTRNGSAAYVGSIARLTPAANGQTGSIFSNDQVFITNWTSTFTFQIQGGSQPNPADGMAFVIQSNSPTALGNGGGSLGYEGIGNSVAIKFDIFDNQGEGTNSTGLYTNGAFPGATGSRNLNGTGIDLRSQRVFRVDMTYNGSVLSVVITDTVTNASNTQNYNVNIAAIVGGNSAFVGFTGATGGLNANHDVLTWQFQSL